MKTKRSRLAMLAAAAVVALAAAVAIWYVGSFTTVNSVRYRKDAEHLDLSGGPLGQIEALEDFRNLKSLDLRGTGVTVEDYEKIQAMHPDCQIRWEVPFQGRFLEEGLEAITVTSLTDEDVAALGHVKTLKTVDSSGCKDYAQLAKLQKLLPDAVFNHEIDLGGETWKYDVERLMLEDLDGDTLMEALSWFPGLKKLHISGSLPAPEQMDALIAAYPGLDISWQLDLDGVQLGQETQVLDLSGQKLTLSDLEACLYYGPSLQTLVAPDSGLDVDTLQDFQDQHPQVQLIWEIEIGGRRFRTDITELDLSHIPMTDVSQAEQWFPYFPNLKTVDMSYTGLSSETLDALNKKYEDIRILWTIQIGTRGSLRTDATYFMPYQMNALATDEMIKELKYCTDMVCIDLGHMMIKSCEFVRYMPNLKYLILADTRLESIEPLRGHKNLVYLEIFITRVTDYTPLLECPALRDLNIANNRGDLTPLTKMTWLERLWIAPLSDNAHKNMPEVHMLRDALPNTQVEYSPYSTGMQWRVHPRYYEMRDILGMHYMK